MKGTRSSLKGWVKKFDLGERILVLSNWNGLFEIHFQESLPNVPSLGALVDVICRIEDGLRICESFQVIKSAPALPFPGDFNSWPQSAKSRFGYLRFRDPSATDFARTKSRIISRARSFLVENDFLEVSTPTLLPGNAVSYPLYGKLYALSFKTKTAYHLSQSPAIYNNLLVLSGLERIFSFSSCFRDVFPTETALREFTQLQVVAASLEKHQFMRLAERLIIAVAESAGYEDLPGRFPEFKYHELEAGLDPVKNYQREFAFAPYWVVNSPIFARNPHTNQIYSATPLLKPLNPEKVLQLSNPSDEELLELEGDRYHLYLDQEPILDGGERNTSRSLQAKVFELCGVNQEEYEYYLEALDFGLSPMGGFSIGLEKLLLDLCGKKYGFTDLHECTLIQLEEAEFNRMTSFNHSELFSRLIESNATQKTQNP